MNSKLYRYAELEMRKVRISRANRKALIRMLEAIKPEATETEKESFADLGQRMFNANNRELAQKLLEEGFSDDEIRSKLCTNQKTIDCRKRKPLKIEPHFDGWTEEMLQNWERCKIFYLKKSR